MSASEGENNNRQPLVDEEPLYSRFPVLSSWEFVLTRSSDGEENGEGDSNSTNNINNSEHVVSGTVYCTDAVSQTVMLIPNVSSSPSSATTTEIRILNSACIRKATKLNDAPIHPADLAEVLSLPTTPIPKKTLDDREKRAIRQAEDTLRHINDKVSAEGQEVFDRLLKACGEVSWKDSSILVLNHIQVDPPYGAENCRILSSPNGNHKQQGSAQEGLDRVRKIVSASRNG